MIVVIGCWSGGSSAAIRMLEAAGAKLGAVEQHGEALELGRVCRKYVEEPTRNWLDPSPDGTIASTPFKGVTDYDHIVALKEIHAVLERLEAFGVDAVKHPGLSHLWPFLPRRYRLLFVYRDGNEIINSMHRRGWWKLGRTEAEHAKLIGEAVNTWKKSMPAREAVVTSPRTHLFDYSAFKKATPEGQWNAALHLAAWFNPDTQNNPKCPDIAQDMVKVVK